jgi:periplasmic protein TonB
MDMLARYASAVTSGTLMTFVLLYVMQLLITLQPGAISEAIPPIPTNWIPVKIRDTPVLPDRPEIIKEELTKKVETPERPLDPTATDSVRVPRGMPNKPPVVTGIDFSGSVDGALVNMFRVSPNYPSRALALGIKGYVIVQFDVDANGQVINVEVIESSDSVFDKESIRAAERFRYKPRVVDGVALVTRGLQNMFTFKLNN